MLLLLSLLILLPVDGEIMQIPKILKLLMRPHLKKVMLQKRRLMHLLLIIMLQKLKRKKKKKFLKLMKTT